MTRCDEVEIPVPAKDKIHKQWCLFDHDQTQHNTDLVTSQPDKVRNPRLFLNVDSGEEEDTDLVTSQPDAVRNPRLFLNVDSGEEDIQSVKVLSRKERSKFKNFSDLELNSRDVK